MKNEEFNSWYNLYPYFKMMENINNNLTKLLKNNKYNDIYYDEEIFYYITSDLLRLIPYKYIKENDTLKLDKKSGILLLVDCVDYIEKKYNKILCFNGYHDVLKDILKIRNKYIHEPHNITYAFSINSTSFYSMGLYYRTQLLSISTVTLTPIVYYLNKIFEKLKNDICETTHQNDNYKNNSFLDRIMKFEFNNKYWNYIITPEYFILDF